MDRPSEVKLTTELNDLLTAEELDAKCELSVVNWEGRLHCAYLNDHRIAGGKPWGGGSTAKRWDTTLREVIRAFPALQRALGIDYFGRPVAGRSVLSTGAREGGE